MDSLNIQASRPRHISPEEWSLRVDLAACYRLVAHFGSLRGIQSASLQALASVVAPHLAAAIYAYFHPAETVASPPGHVV